jgi:threonine dehydrogenase-like Zn-dependent dehydrogenase
MLADHALALAAVRRSRFEPGDHVAVFGLNPAGLAAVRLARHFDAGRIDCIGDAPEALEIVHAEGVRKSSATDYDRWVRESSEELPRRLLLFASWPGLLELAVNAVGRRGVIVVVGGAAPEDASIPNYYLNMIMKETAIIGLRAPTPAEQQEAEKLLRSGWMT